MSTRKLSMIFLLGIMLIILIAACQKSTTTVDPTRTAGPLSMTVTATMTTTLNAGMSPTPTLNDISGMVNATPVPAWKGIPLMPGALAGTENSSGYLYSIKGVPSEVIAFYAQQMPKLGWESKPKNGTPEPNGQFKLVYTKGDNMFLVAIFPRTDGTLVMLGMQSN